MRPLAIIGLAGLASCAFQSAGELELFACDDGGYCNAAGSTVAVTSEGASSGSHKSSGTTSRATTGSGSSGGSSSGSASSDSSSGGSTTVVGTSSGSSSASSSVAATSSGGSSSGNGSSGSSSSSSGGTSTAGGSSGANCGNFSSLSYYFTGSQGYTPYVLATGQLSGLGELTSDGDEFLPDIVTGDQSGGTIPPTFAALSVYLNQGYGVFPTQGTYYAADAGGSGTANPTSIVVADFTGNGKNDVGLTVLGNAIAVYYNQSLGFFPSTPTWLWGSTTDVWLSLAAADVNQDGITDLVVEGSAGIEVFLGAGAGLSVTPEQFASSQKLGGAYAQASFVSADFNGDGWPDVASLLQSGNDIAIFLNDAGSFPSTPLLLSDPAAPSGLAVGDFNHDGQPDLAVSSTTNSVVSLFLNQGGGLFGGAKDLQPGRHRGRAARSRLQWRRLVGPGRARRHDGDDPHQPDRRRLRRRGQLRGRQLPDGDRQRRFQR